MGLPVGTVTFVFTDIEGSTRLVGDLGPAYDDVLRAHHAILRRAFGAVHGYEVRTAGDSFFLAFPSAPDAIAGVVAAQRELAAYDWPGERPVRVRMGVHTGDGPLSADDYGGIDVNRAARIGAAAHGGQVLISATTRSLVERHLPIGVELRDLGEHRLPDLDEPEHLFQLQIPGLPTDFPALRSLTPPAGNLPRPLTSFVGRARDLHDLKASISDDVRLLTLLGPGGSGKTRLAIELAAKIRAQFSDGSFFVPLAGVADPALIAPAIAHALEVRELGGQSLDQQLFEYLCRRNVLLVLDNFEHLVGGAPFISDLLASAPNVKVLVTSRVNLGLLGEHVYPVEPLPLAPADSADARLIARAESVKLFVARARAVSPRFELVDANAKDVADLCARLDGLPLAIELAAARARSLTPAAMLGRIDQRLDSLIGGPLTLPPRQRTLRATIAWSYELLDDGERRLFARMSVFAGGAALDDIEAVCGPPSNLGADIAALGADTASLVASLVDHSLLRPVHAAAEARFEMLETIREFAAERLIESGEADVIRDRHVARFADLARRAEPELMGPSPAEWLEHLDREHDNLSAALDRLSAVGSSELAARMPAMLWRSWQMSGRLTEGRRRTERALSLDASHHSPENRRSLLEAAGGIAYWQGDFDTAAVHYEGALGLARQTGRADLIADALYNLSFARSLGFQGGDPTIEGWSRGIGMLEESLELYSGLGQPAGSAKVLWALSEAARTSGDLTRATVLIEKCLTTFRGLRDEFHVGWVLRSLALLQHQRGDLTGANRSAIEGLGLFHSRHDVTGVLFFLSILARLALDNGQIERGLRLGGATRSLQVSSGAELLGVAYSFAGTTWDEELARLGPDAQGFWDAGGRMTADDAVSYALASA